MTPTADGLGKGRDARSRAEGPACDLRRQDRERGWEFVVAHLEPLTAFVRARAPGGEDAASDVVQETLVRAYSGLAGFEGRCLFGTWICAIATNVILEAERRRSAVPLEWVSEAELARLGRELPPDLSFEREETRELVAAALRSLRPRHCAALVARYAEDLTREQIARRGAESVVGTKSLIRRARRALAIELTRRLNGGQGARAVPRGAHARAEISARSRGTSRGSRVTKEPARRHTAKERVRASAAPQPHRRGKAGALPIRFP